MRSAIFLLALIPTLLSAQFYWQQDVHYAIDASLDPDRNVIAGRETLEYKNNSPDTLREVFFRLYWNLFTKNSYGQRFEERNRYYFIDTSGGVTIRAFTVSGHGKESVPEYTIDNTIMRASLPEPLPPGSSVTFAFDFEENIHSSGVRSGHQGRDYNIAQWYPQISTYDKHGWDKTQYLGPAEFHNEYGSFDVSVTLPRSFTLGYTGTLLNPDEVYPDSVRRRLKESFGDMQTVRIADYSGTQWGSGDTARVTWRCHADSVRDFAFAANEHYIWDVTYWSPAPGQRPIAIHAMYFTDKAEFWTEAAKIGQHAISFFSTHFGLYAYPSMFIIEGVVGGGMEYPGIIFNGHLGDKNSHTLFGVLTHEVGHSWYPMMIGSDETYYAFMDEGFNTFITSLAMEDYYGPVNNEYTWTEWYQKLLCFPNDNSRDRLQRGSFWLAETGFEEPIATHTLRFEEQGLSGNSIYTKTAAVMYMLQYVLGDSVFGHVMKEYYTRWKFKHPYPEDFYALAEQASGVKDLRWFFDEWFNRTETCDYSVCGLRSSPQRGNDGTYYRTTFSVRRNRPAIMPVDVRITMADGSTRTVWFPIDLWKNAEGRRDTTVLLPSEPVRADLNPDGRILDINRLNNSTALPKITTRFDNTMFSVTPVDAYLLMWRPSVWYTDQGGWKAGYKLSGSYLDDLYATTIWNWYNFRDNTFNYDLSVSQNTYTITPMSRASVRWYRIEGRKGVTATAWKGLSSHWSYPPYQSVSFTYSYVQADNPDYHLHPEVWQEGVLHRIQAGYDYSNRGRFWTVHAAATLESSTSLFGRSDFQYAKRTLLLNGSLTIPGNWTLALRFYSGIGYGDVPNQAKYYLASASPIEEMGDPFFRSKGPLPSTVRDHALLPGGGLMRAYYGIPVAGDKLDAFNAEARFTTLIPFIDPDIPVFSSLSRMVRSVLFFDAGRLADQTQKLWDQRFEVDCGVGFRLASFYSLLGTAAQSDILSSIGFSTLRVDFPFYASMPPPDESKLKFRWVISLREAF